MAKVTSLLLANTTQDGTSRFLSDKAFAATSGSEGQISPHGYPLVGAHSTPRGLATYDVYLVHCRFEESARFLWITTSKKIRTKTAGSSKYCCLKSRARL